MNAPATTSGINGKRRMVETSQHVVKISADLSQLQNSFKQVENTVGNLGGKLKGLAATFISFKGAEEIIKLSASLRGLQERIALTSKNQGEFNQTMTALFGIAQRTGVELREIQKSYADISVAAAGSGIAQKTLLQIIETTIKAVKVSGGDIGSTEYALKQFIKTLVTGETSSRQFVAILSSSSYLTKVLADAITNGSVPALQAMAQEGKLTREQMLKLGDPEIAAQVSSVYKGIGDGADEAFTRLKNSLTHVFKEIDSGAQLSENLARVMNDLSTAIDTNAAAWANLAEEGISTLREFLPYLKDLATLSIIRNADWSWIDSLIKKLSELGGWLNENYPMLEKFGDWVLETSAAGGLDFSTWFKDADKPKEAISGITDELEDMGLEFGLLETDADTASATFHKISSEAKSLSTSLDKLKDSIDLKTSELHAENLQQPLEEADKIAQQLAKDLERNKQEFSELGDVGKKKIDAINESLKKMREESLKKKNLAFMEFAEGEIRDQEEKAQKAFAEPFIHAAENIQDAFGETFADIFENGVDSFGDLADKMKSIMLKAAAEIAAAMVFKPAIGGAVSGLLGSVAPDLVKSIMAGLGTEQGGGMGGIAGNVFSGASSVFSLASGSTTTALTGLGMPAGLASGLGVALPVIGIGMALAGIAGMFGGKKKHPQASFGGTLGEGNAFDGFDLRSKHMGTEGAQQLAETLDNIFKSLGSSGINLNSPTIQGRITPEGAQFGTGSALNGGTINWKDIFDPSDAKALDGSIKDLMQDLIKTADITNTDVIKALKDMQWEGKKVEEVLAELQLASTFQQLRVELGKALNQDLVSMFDPALAEIGAENQRYINQLAIAKQISGDVATVERLHQQKLAEIQRKYGQSGMLSDGAVTSVTDLNDALREASSRFKTFADIVESLADFATSLKLGSLSPLSATEKYRIAQSNFEQTSARARLGDVDAMKSLPGVAQEFLSISREFNAGSGAYTEDFNKVQAAVEDSKAVAERQRDLAAMQSQTLSAQLAELEKQTELLGQLVDAKNPKGYSYGAAYLQALGNPGASGLVNTGIGETLDSVKKMAWGGASGLEVRALGRSFGYSGDYGTGLFDKWLEVNRGDLLTAFNDALIGIGGTPKFRAGGGMVSPAFPYIVGESGAEMFQPSVQGRISSAHDTAVMMNAANGNGDVVAAVRSLTNAVLATNNRVEILQKQVNSNMLFRKVA